MHCLLYHCYLFLSLCICAICEGMVTGSPSIPRVMPQPIPVVAGLDPSRVRVWDMVGVPRVAPCYSLRSVDGPGPGSPNSVSLSFKVNSSSSISINSCINAWVGTGGGVSCSSSPKPCPGASGRGAAGTGASSSSSEKLSSTVVRVDEGWEGRGMGLAGGSMSAYSSSWSESSHAAAVSSRTEPGTTRERSWRAAIAETNWASQALQRGVCEMCRSMLS